MKTSRFLYPVILMFVLSVSCSKEDTPAVDPPTLTTKTVTYVGLTSAYFTGELTVPLIEVETTGFCWSTHENPTTSDNKLAAAAQYTGYSMIITGLAPNTTYYVRAFATHEGTTGYGNQVEFTTLTDHNGETGSVTDSDGNTYPTVGIGGQIWMAENLATTTFNDGSSIPHITEIGDWNGRTTPAYCLYDNNEDNREVYGMLYNGYTIDSLANGGKSICPPGWHIPTSEDFYELGYYLSGLDRANKLKEAGSLHWLDSNEGTNATGFTAVPGGSRTPAGYFDAMGTDCILWSSSQYMSGSSLCLYIITGSSASSGGNEKSWGFSVRCIKDR